MNHSVLSDRSNLTAESLAEVLKPCPFCGWQAGDDLIDVVYPSGTYRRVDARHGYHHYVSHNQSQKGDEPCWGVNCTTNMGGCGASISGDSREEAVAAWNRRVVTSATQSDPKLNESDSAPITSSI